jgi:cathepsin L
MASNYSMPRAIYLLAACIVGYANAIAMAKTFIKTEDANGLPTFDRFLTIHGRDLQVNSEEYASRRSIYERRLETIAQHNSNPDRLWNAGVNHLSDRTEAEFRERLGWRHHSADAKHSALGASLLELDIERSTPVRAEEKDYLNLSVALDVQDQGGCGSCWAVATTELLKAHDEIHNGNAREFSAQELVSCVQNKKKCGGSGGCEGATVELALDYIMNNGLRTTEDVPYQGQTGVCDKEIIVSKLGELDKDGRVLFNVGTNGKAAEFIQKGKKHVRKHRALSHQLGGEALGLQGFYTIQKNKYEPLMWALMERGPVGITVAASDWAYYSSGVFDRCTDPTLNHAVVLMGVGKEKVRSRHVSTYIVKNSWGPGWGENGYIKLLRTDHEESNCAKDYSPKDGVACEGGPSMVEVCGTCGILYDNVVPIFKKSA